MAMGKGLGALLSDASFDYERELSKEQITDVVVSAIKPNPFQPRRNFDKDALEDLAQSLEKHGLIQPIVVIKKDENSFTLIAGERRLRAAKLLGWEKIKAYALNIDEQNLRELALIENIQREDLNELEVAISLKELIDEHKITQEELAGIVKKSRVWVTNKLRLLNLSADTKELIMSGKITGGHAKVLVGLSDKDEKMLTKSIVGQKLSVRQTENLVQELKKPEKTQELKDAINKLKTRFKELGIPTSSAKNKITLAFENSKEIENLIEKLSKF